MRIVIADDDVAARRLLETRLRDWEYDVLVAEDGQQAWEALRTGDAPLIAILDWQIPEASSPSLCRRVRELDRFVPPYVMLLGAQGHRAQVLAALEQGADDF